MISPSRIKTFLGSPMRASSLSLRALLKVDLPAPESPVNQKVPPLRTVYFGLAAGAAGLG